MPTPQTPSEKFQAARTEVFERMAKGVGNVVRGKLPFVQNSVVTEVAEAVVEEVRSNLADIFEVN